MPRRVLFPDTWMRTASSCLKKRLRDADSATGDDGSEGTCFDSSWFDVEEVTNPLIAHVFAVSRGKKRSELASILVSQFGDYIPAADGDAQNAKKRHKVVESQLKKIERRIDETKCPLKQLSEDSKDAFFGSPLFTTGALPKLKIDANKMKAVRQKQREAAEAASAVPPGTKLFFPEVGSFVFILADTMPGVESAWSASDAAVVTEVHDDHCIVQTVLRARNDKQRISRPQKLLQRCTGGDLDFMFVEVDNRIRKKAKQSKQENRRLSSELDDLKATAASAKKEDEAKLQAELQVIQHDHVREVIAVEERLKKQRERAERVASDTVRDLTTELGVLNEQLASVQADLQQAEEAHKAIQGSIEYRVERRVGEERERSETLQNEQKQQEQAIREQQVTIENLRQGAAKSVRHRRRLAYRIATDAPQLEELETQLEDYAATAKHYASESNELKQKTEALMQKLYTVFGLSGSSASAALGTQPGKTYDLDLVELFMNMLTHGVSCAACSAILEGVVAFENRKEEAAAAGEIRVPQYQRFSEWRFWIADITQFLSLRVLAHPDAIIHSFHDATTKDHWHMFGVMARAQIPDDKGGTRLVEVPVDLCVIHDSKSATEADAFAKAFTSRLHVDQDDENGCRPIHVSLVKIMSIISDHAKNATATSKAVLANRQQILDKLVKCRESQWKNLQGLPEAEVEWYKSLTPEQQQWFEKTPCHIIHCANHLTALLAEKGQKRENEIAKQQLAELLTVELEATDALLERMPGEVVHMLVKLFAEYGTNGSYYLNKHVGLHGFVQEFNAKAEAEGREEQTMEIGRALSAKKGSRAFIEVKLAAEILLKRVAFTRYLDELKQQNCGESNKLIDSSFDGIRNVVIIHALKARAFRYVALVAPLVFFTNRVAHRPEMRRIYELAKETIQSWKGLTSTSSVPVYDTFAKAVLQKFCQAQFPHYHTEYNAWMRHQKNSFDIINEEILNPIDKSEVEATQRLWVQQLVACVDTLLETLEENLDDDAEGVDELRLAPMNTDPVESLHGTTDYQFAHLQAGPHARMSVGVGVKSHSFRTQRECIRKERRRRERAHCMDGVRAMDHHIELDATNFSRLPKNMRHAILQAARKRTPQRDAERERDKTTHLKAARARDKALKEANERKVRTAVVRAVALGDVKLYTTIKSLKSDLNKNVKGNNLGLKFLRTQLRVRRNVYGQKAGGNLVEYRGQPEKERERLLKLVVDLIKSDPKPKSTLAQRLLPSGYETRATDTPLAKELVEDALQLVREIIAECKAELDETHFMLDNEKLRRSKKKREPNAEERELVNRTFMDEDHMWRVVDVYWSSTHKGICVDYYDENEAEKAGHTHDWFVSGVQDNADNEHKKEVEELLMYSYVYEVFEWIDLAEEEDEAKRALRV